MFDARENEARSQHRRDDGADRVERLRDIQASRCGSRRSEHGHVRIRGHLEHTLTARQHEQRRQEEWVPARRRCRLKQQRPQRAQAKADQYSTPISKPAHQPACRQRHDEISTEERGLDQRRLKVTQVERLFQVRNEHVVEVDTERPQKEERRDQHERNDVAALRQWRTAIGHAFSSRT